LVGTDGGCKVKEGGEEKCTIHNGTWVLQDSKCNAPAPGPSPTPTPEPSPVTCSFSTFCDCTNAEGCGWCSGHELVGGVEKPWAFCKQITNGQEVCHHEGGLWTKGVQDKCQEHPPLPTTETWFEADATGTLNSGLNETVTSIIEQVIQSLVAHKLGVDPDKVQVVVKVTPKSDGTTDFTVSVKVSSADVKEGDFKAGVDSILSENVRSSLSDIHGVDVKLGAFSPVNADNFAGKLIISLIVSIMVILM
jgi:hypothetical protein